MFLSGLDVKRMKKLVVVGGGFAGSFIARELQRDFNVVLIDTKEYFEFTPSILRCLVDREHLKNIEVRHGLYFKGEIIIGGVNEVFLDCVVVNGKKINYDYLVICSGSRYNLPFKEEIAIAERGADVGKYYERLKNAGRVLIIGGGIVGVELTGEIIWKYPEKKIVIVHPYDRLMQRCAIGVGRYVDGFFKRNNVEIIYNERIVKDGKGIFFTDKNRKINADMGFLCTGIKANSELLKGFRGVVDEKGFVKVNGFLQLAGYDKIFVAGDVNNVKEEKTAQNAEEQAKIVVDNLRRLERGKPLIMYKSKPRIMVISLGKLGVLTYKNFMMAGLFPGWLKGKIERREMKKRKG